MVTDEPNEEAKGQSPTDRLHSYLRNLFDGPNRNLESAFGMLLDMVKEQASEQSRLKSAYEELEEKHVSDQRRLEEKRTSDQRRLEEKHTSDQRRLETAVQERHEAFLEKQTQEYKNLMADHERIKGAHERLEADRESIKDAHERLQGAHEKLEGAHEELRGGLEKLQDSHEQLQTAHDKLQDSHKNSITDIHELKEEIKVLAFNFHAFDEESEEGTPASKQSAETLPEHEQLGSVGLQQALSEDPLESKPQELQEKPDAASNTSTQNAEGPSNSNNATEQNQPDQILSKGSLSHQNEDHIRADKTRDASGLPDQMRGSEKHDTSEFMRDKRMTEVKADEKEAEALQGLTQKIHGNTDAGGKDEKEGEKAQTNEAVSVEADQQQPVVPAKHGNMFDVSNKISESPKKGRSLSSLSVIENRRRGPRASINVAKHKLDASQTLAVRLERLEASQQNLENVARLAQDLKARFEGHLANLDGNRDSASKEDLVDIITRVMTMEESLAEFGKALSSTAEQTEAQGNSLEELYNLQLTKAEAADESDAVDAPRKLSFLMRKQDEDTQEHIKQHSLQLSSQMRKHEEDTQESVKQLSLQLSSLMRKHDEDTQENIKQLTLQLDVLREQVAGRVSECVSRDDDNADACKQLGERVANLSDKLVTLEQELNGMISRSDLVEILKALGEEQGESNNSPSSYNEAADRLEIFKRNLDEQLAALQKCKLERSEFVGELNVIEKRLSGIFGDKISTHESLVDDSLQNVCQDLTECKAYINMLEANMTQWGPQNDSEDSSDSDADIDAKIKESVAANFASLQESLHEALAKKLDDIIALEKELERVTSQLAERPDENQIARMFQELEDTLAQRLENGQTLHNVMKKMRLELGQKITKHEVQTLTKQMLSEAKKGIENQKDTLMIGYRCLACNELFQRGVHNRPAEKVNHKALPASGFLSTSRLNARRSDKNTLRRANSTSSRWRPRNLKPVQIHATVGRRRTYSFGLPRRPFTSKW